ncbi:alpha/beta hydrolase family protein [Verrucomicrobium spinosum]|nr:prolyl oligopeptidase family serine peptidase [Verrucomicrobium spinosum]
MDLSGMRPEEADPNKRTRIPDGGPDQGHPAKFDTIRTEDITDDWPLHAVANGILAHSLLLSFPEVDKDRTAVTGISWGGYTTCIVASVDSRFKAAVPVYGCGFLEQNSCWLGEFTKLGPDLTKKWVERYDPSSHLPRCTVPIFFMNGTNDFAYPLDSYMKSYDAVSKTAKNIRIQIKMPHGHGVGWEPKEIGLWVDQQLGLGDGKALATCTAPVLADGKVTAKITHSLPVKSAAFNYALPGEAVNKREWKSIPATVENNVVTAPAAEPGSDMWFFTVTDERDAMVSSPVAFK